MWIKKGVKLLEEQIGEGTPVERQRFYVVAIRITLNQGDIVSCPGKCLSHQIDSYLETKNDGYFIHNVRIDRENFLGGFFYAILGMNVGGYRKVQIAPHLAYGEKGVPDIIPPNAKLTVEIKVLRGV